jgi:hypothetical protein
MAIKYTQGFRACPFQPNMGQVMLPPEFGVRSAKVLSGLHCIQHYLLLKSSILPCLSQVTIPNRYPILHSLSQCLLSEIPACSSVENL